MMDKTLLFYVIGLLTMLVGIERIVSTLTMAYLGSLGALKGYSLAWGILILIMALFSFRQAGRYFKKVRIFTVQ